MREEKVLIELKRREGKSGSLGLSRLVKETLRIVDGNGIVEDGRESSC